MRWPGLFAAVVFAACGSGSGSSQALQQQVTFGFVRADAPTSREVRVANPLEAVATAEDAGGSGGPFAPAAGALPAFVPMGGDLTLTVVCIPSGVGKQSGQIRLRFVAGDQRSEIVLRLDAIVESATVTLLTPSLTFGTTLMGTERSMDLRVRNPNQVTPVNLSSISALPTEFTSDFRPGALEPGDTATIRVTYAPKTPTAFGFDIEITNSLGLPLSARIKALAERWVSELTKDFGDVPLFHGSDTDWLEVDVPAVAISLSIEAVASSPSTNVTFLNLEGPGGTVYANPAGTGPLVWYPPAAGVLSATLPCTDMPNVQLVAGGGTYRFRLHRTSGSGTSFHVRAIVENRDGIPANEGQLDLNVFLAPGLNMASPSTDTKLQAVLSQVDDLFSQVGLRLGNIDYYEPNDPSLNYIDEVNLSKSVEKSSVASGSRMNVFFVESVAYGPYPVRGLAAAIGGPKAKGTGASGVAVDFDVGDTAEIGFVTAHEIGHHLGLWHTTEADGTVDGISDTLPCPAKGTSSACPTVGGDYLMFWLYVGNKITAGQAHVILGHPLVDPISPLAGFSALAQKNAPAPAFVQLPPGFCGTCRPHK